MSDREILDKFVNLDHSCLNTNEMKSLLDMLYKYKGAFSVRLNWYMLKY